MDHMNERAEKLVEEVDESTSTEQLQDRSAQSKDLQPGEMVADRYKVLGLIGRGAMGTVYECEQVFLKKKCAIKVLNATVSEQATRRFQKESQAISKLEHANI